MLGNCIIRNPRTKENKFDKGVICESLLFFGKTHLVIDHGTLHHLLHADFMDELIELLKRGHLSANYSPELTALVTNKSLGISDHEFALIKLVGDQKTGALKRNQEILEFDLLRFSDDKARARKLYRELRSLISFKDLGASHIPAMAKSDLKNREISTELARLALLNKGIPPELISFTRLDIFDLAGNKFVIDTDIDFEKLKEHLSKEDQKAFSKSDLFPGLGDARLNIHLAAEHNAAFIGNEKDQIIINMLLRRSIGASFPATDTIQTVYDFISIDVPTVRAVINNGNRTIGEFLRLLDKASSFRKWLNAQNPDKSLLVEMLREKSSEGWLSSLPKKSGRFGLFVGAGAVADLVATGGLRDSCGCWLRRYRHIFGRSYCSPLAPTLLRREQPKGLS